MATIPGDSKVLPTKRMFAKMSAQGLNGQERVECFKSTIEQNMFTYMKSSFAPKEGDLFIVTFPKCGTTWTQQIAKLIRNNGQESGMDIDEAFPWIELMSPEEVDALPSPRGFKCHIPYKLVPGGKPHTTPAKYISIYRNPKDVTVSLYHQARSMFFAELTWEEFFEDFISGKFEGRTGGSCVEYFLEWWEHKDAENVLVLSFEWMKANHRAAVETIAKFAGYDLTPSAIDSIVDQTSFANMKTNPAANNSWMKPYFTDSSTDFMRKGKVGGWRDYFTDEQSARMDEKFKKQLEGTGLELHILNAYEQNIN